MKNIEKEVFQPFVTIKDVVAYSSDKPETWTRSELVNAFCRTIERLGPAASGKEVAEAMGLNYQKLNGAIEIICGATISVVKTAILEQKLLALRAQHPYWTTDKLAQNAGLYDRSSIRRILGENVYKSLLARNPSDEKRKMVQDFNQFVESQK